MTKRKLNPKALYPGNMMKRIRTIGGVPGEVIFTGEQKLAEVEIQYIEYNNDHIIEESVTGESIQNFHEPDDNVMQWYDIRGLHNTALIQEIGEIFSIHQLVLEDVADTYQRPKYEEYEDGIFITFKKMKLNETTNDIEQQQVSIYFGQGFLISFQEEPSDIFHNVKERLRKSSGRIRKRGADYLAYTLIDAIADSYFTILDKVELFIENKEYQINKNPKENLKTEIHDMKMELLQMRKSVAPLREAIGRFVRSDSSLLDENSLPFLQDLYDHTIQINDIVESSRDSLIGLQDLYMSEVSFRMNQIMKVLTVVTTVFIPLSFLTGLYGMNFKNMPELHYQNGYFILLVLMAVIVVGLLFYFKHKKWL